MAGTRRGPVSVLLKRKRQQASRAWPAGTRQRAIFSGMILCERRVPYRPGYLNNVIENDCGDSYLRRKLCRAALFVA